MHLLDSTESSSKGRDPSGLSSAHSSRVDLSLLVDAADAPDGVDGTVTDSLKQRFRCPTDTDFRLLSKLALEAKQIEREGDE